MTNIYLNLAQQVGNFLKQRGLKLVTAESCTGGQIAQIVTMVAGSSQWFERGFVTYSNEAKQEVLGIDAATLQQHGAVSEAIVRAMATGALKVSRADISIAVTGIAGPDGGSQEKPVGTVWIGWANRFGLVEARCYLFKGDRLGIRDQACIAALQNLMGFVAAC